MSSGKHLAINSSLYIPERNPNDGALPQQVFSTLQLGGTLQLGRPSLSDCSCQIFILCVTTA